MVVTDVTKLGSLLNSQQKLPSVPKGVIGGDDDADDLQSAKKEGDVSLPLHMRQMLPKI